MNKNKLKRLLAITLVFCAVCLLGACSRLAAIKLPPLPTPSAAEPSPAEDAYIQTPSVLPEAPQEFLLEPSPTPAPDPIPQETPVITPEPLPEPTAEPENPNIPHLYIENETYPESMGRYGAAYLYGNIYTDKGLIIQVCGRIYNNDTDMNDQICMYYPYQSSFSLADTVNAKLVFGALEPGHYTYIVSAIAENNSYTGGEVVLIEHGFEIYYD